MFSMAIPMAYTGSLMNRIASPLDLNGAFRGSLWEVEITA